MDTPSADKAPVPAPRPNETPNVGTKPETKDVPVLECPYCGESKWAMNMTRLSHCGVCGMTADYMYKDPRWKAAADKVYAAMRGNPALPDERTPRCKQVGCGSQAWAHDGTKLLYCTKCGANWPKGEAQPSHLSDIIKRLGDTAAKRSPVTPGPVKATDLEKARERIAAGPNK